MSIWIEGEAKPRILGKAAVRIKCSKLVKLCWT